MDKPNFQVAKINMINALRSLVGLPKMFPVKIVRTPEAKLYKLMGISKAGDVGYNLPASRGVVIPAATPEQRRQYSYHTERADRYHDLSNTDFELMHRNLALEALPKASVPTGIKIEMPNNLWCSIEARSSSSNKLLITPDAIIDAGYRGELFGVIYNFGYSDYRVTAGEMLVQVIFHERIIAKMIETNELSTSERGETGFGSAGSTAEKV